MRMWKLYSALSLAAICCAEPIFDRAAFGARFEEIKKSANKQQLYAFLYDLPKGGDLHNHFGLSFHAQLWYEGATNPKILRGNEFFTRVSFNNCEGQDGAQLRFRTIQRSTYRKLSDCEKKEYASLASLSPKLKDEWISAMILDKPGEGRNEFFEVIGQRLGELFRDPNLVLDLMVENMKRRGAEGLRYIEAMAGSGMFQDQEGARMDPAAGAALIRERLKQPDAIATGVTMRFQGGFLRFAPNAEENLERAFEFVDQNRDLWVGINMAGREDNDKGHPLRFLEPYRKMRRKYSSIPLALHGGEVDSPGADVRRTLLIGAERIGHGVNLITDPDTMLLMRNNRYLIEINLVSNKLLEYTKPDHSDHPFPEYLRFGIPVCLNSDDPGVWDSIMTDEYFTAVSLFNLSWSEIVGMGRNSLQYSFAQPELKAKMIADYEQAVSDFEKKYLGGDWKATVGGVKPASSGYAYREWGIKY